MYECVILSFCTLLFGYREDGGKKKSFISNKKREMLRKISVRRKLRLLDFVFLLDLVKR